VGFGRQNCKLRMDTARGVVPQRIGRGLGSSANKTKKTLWESDYFSRPDVFLWGNSVCFFSFQTNFFLIYTRWCIELRFLCFFFFFLCFFFLTFFCFFCLNFFFFQKCRYLGPQGPRNRFQAGTTKLEGFGWSAGARGRFAMAVRRVSLKQRVVWKTLSLIPIDRVLPRLLFPNTGGFLNADSFPSVLRIKPQHSMQVRYRRFPLDYDLVEKQGHESID